MARRRKGDAVHGWVLLDKPLEMSSAAAVAKVKFLFHAAKAGHAGTLDPLATGMLPIALGEATKTVPFIMDSRKTYGFTVRWGHETTTDDLEGTPGPASAIRPQAHDINGILPDFLGQITQIPPAFSAIKTNGIPAYEIARAGGEIQMQAREVRIFALALLEARADQASFEVTCGKGTYVRALARDIGRALGAACHVSQLRRLDVGPFRRHHMIPLEKLQELAHKAPGPEGLSSALCPLETALDDIPALALSEADAARLRNGQPVFLAGQAVAPEGNVLAVLGGKPVALTTLRGSCLEPKRVFNL